MNLIDLYREHLGDWLVFLLPSLAVSIEVAVLSILIGLVVGLPVALAKMSRPRLLRYAANGYIEVLRGTPALVQLFFVYFGLPGFGITLDAFPAAVLTFGLNAAAYMAEIYRSGLQAIDPGQRQAALALGLTPTQTMRRVLLPQAIRVVLPPAGSLGIAVFKDSSLATVISLPELMTSANVLVGVFYRPFAVYVVAAALYAAVALPASVFIRRRDRSRRWIGAN